MGGFVKLVAREECVEVGSMPRELEMLIGGDLLWEGGGTL